ncbi:HAMP domain-containing sensor histidine kinase [Mesobacillus foraminis]|uniref:HAMP domain-containing sensor histidine kinase n=1 Tax=Mesobacillus foraminis TaxID=279826 RepID=UPI000EF45B71|nr:HAMP domain-containing sensor histidine kinase [Mesobacillus foraminis]
MKLKNSLLNQYLLIILLAIMIMPISFPLISMVFYVPFSSTEELNHLNSTDMESMWHKEAKSLEGASDQQIKEKLEKLKVKYPEANMFWVDESGNARDRLPKELTLQQNWSPEYTINFMKKNRGDEADPFTVVALIGKGRDEGFMVLQLPRSELRSNGERMQDKYSYLMTLLVFIILGTFLFVSWIFFYRIRKRLLRLRTAMAEPADHGIPEPIAIGKKDEIGQLEISFNNMIQKLEHSREREQEEEVLRRQLIANLSHDLRTPLTTIRGHAFSLKKEPLSEKGLESLQLIDTKVNYLGQLIENLLSYTLLTAGKYPFNPVKTDMVRLVRTSFAGWYPVFENAGFHIELDLPDQTFYWEIDSQWMERILDNFYQNVHRHAREGQYISVKINPDLQQITIADRGPGMNGESTGKGAGIGLTIVSLMLKEMKLDWETRTGTTGTAIIIKKR